MTADQVDNLFQAFTQADASTTRKYGGTGLGLALSRRLCELMGGTIIATSESGVGSRFTVRLPFTSAEHLDDYQYDGNTSRIELYPVSAADPGEWIGSPVLVIDDDPAVCDVMTRYLTKEGFLVETALSGEEGLRLANEIMPDMIILDVLMPDIDGWVVLTSLKSNPELSNIPVIMLTIVDDKDHGYMLGAADYLLKPIDRRHLIGLLKKYHTPAVANEQSQQRALVVANPEDLDQVIRPALSENGWDITEATSCEAALMQVEQCKPDLIFLDLMLTQSNSIQLVDDLHRTAIDSSVPIIAITPSDPVSEDYQKLRASVIQTLQSGTYSRDELLAHVQRAVVSRLGKGSRAPTELVHM